ncbi:MAG: spore cortex biosynthesis protein YabQ [Clostridia bacterium]|nr:spore cortex biosynthesis protein YabQ [Clostridia bacterium]
MLLAMMLCGALLAAAYDALWVLRKVFFPGKIALALMDLLFGVFCALGIIASALVLKVDAMRAYVLVGALLGMGMYRASAGAALRRVTAWIISCQKRTENEK